MERFTLGSRFSELLLLDVPGTATEHVRTCGRKTLSLVKIGLIFNFVTKTSISSFMRENRFQQEQPANDVQFSTIPKGGKGNINKSTFVFPVYTFPSQETYLFTRQFKAQIGKGVLIIESRKEKCQLWREINTSPPHPSFKDRVFSIFRQKKCTGPIHQKSTSRWLIPHRHKK